MTTRKKIVQLPRRLLSDSRGWFVKIVDGTEEGNPFPCEVYITSARPGERRGGHYHRLANEWFTLLSGEAVLSLRDAVTGEESEVRLDASNPVTIHVPPGMAHSFLNSGNADFILAAFTDRTYDPGDTVPETF